MYSDISRHRGKIRKNHDSTSGTRHAAPMGTKSVQVAAAQLVAALKINIFLHFKSLPYNVLIDTRHLPNFASNVIQI